MNRRRREFSQSDKIAIRGRATDSSGRVHCERCGRWCPKRADYQIDHVLAEGMRPLADLTRKLTPADGQLLCVAVCHPGKTADDVGSISEAKRREAAALSIKRPSRAYLPRPPKPPLKVAAGKPRIAREYGL
jgi:hypothetical protein